MTQNTNVKASRVIKCLYSLEKTFAIKDDLHTKFKNSQNSTRRQCASTITAQLISTRSTKAVFLNTPTSKKTKRKAFQRSHKLYPLIRHCCLVCLCLSLSHKHTQLLITKTRQKSVHGAQNKPITPSGKGRGDTSVIHMPVG